MRSLKLMILSVLTALTLSGCVHSGSKLSVDLPRIPQELRDCVNYLVPSPSSGTLTKKELMALVADLRKNDVKKTQCANRGFNLSDSVLDSVSAYLRSN